MPRPPWGCCELYSAINCRAVAINPLARGNGEFLRLPFRKAWCSFRAAVHCSGRSLGTRSAVGGPEAIKPLSHRPKPALDQLRLGMAGQAVLPLDSQPDQYATTFRREVDAADFLVVFAVIHIEDLGNPKALNPYSQCRADGV